jgi:ubiquinone/menaquinone biosynthesis C-methylase UbiE
MDIAEYRTLSHDIWEKMAAGWDDWNTTVVDASRPVTEQMVAALAPRPAETILELAGGAGVSGFAAAALLQGEGRLIMTDFAENMVEAQRRRGAELGFDNVEYRVMDAEHMDLDDDSVDGVLCRWGYMLMADPVAALRETRRVLRDGGRLSFSVWGAPADNPFENFDRVWAYITDLAGAIALVIAQLDERERTQLRAETEKRFAKYATDGGRYEVPGVCINALTR